MELPQIRIESRHTKIDMSTTSALLEIEQPQADVSIEQPQADLTIETTRGTLTIDQKQAWEEMDLKHIFRRIEEAANLGYQDLLKGIARRTQDGDQMMRIEIGGKPLVDQAKSNSERPKLEFSIGFIPSYGSVKLHYTPAKVNINVNANKPIMNITPNKPIINYHPGNVNVSVSQYSSLKIDFANLKYSGLNYEQEI